MEELFYNISLKDRDKLIKLLEGHTLQYKKDTSMLSTLKDSIIGIVLEGTASIIRTDYNGNSTIIEKVNKGMVFGTEISSLSNNEYELISTSDCMVLILEVSEIYNIQNGSYYYNQFVRNLLKITTDRINLANERIEILTKKSIRDKLLEFFRIYCKKHGGKTIILTFTFNYLADYINVDRSAMMREIKKLIDDGIIKKEGKVITLNY